MELFKLCIALCIYVFYINISVFIISQMFIYIKFCFAWEEKFRKIF